MVLKTHEVEGLNEAESSQLLVKHAFKNGYVSNPSYADVLTRTITYASGLPLALEAIGSHLCKKKVEEWESALNKFERHLDNNIHEILRVSFDALGKEEHSVFLDIACCFKGYELKEVTDLLQAHYGSCMKYHIGVLVEKSLIKINLYNLSVTMHSLIENMGKEIVVKESPEMPGKRSRLWFSEDIIKVLQDNLMLITLKVLNFDYSNSLKEIPDVSNLQTLEEFSFEGCSNLVSIHSSVGFLPKLKILNAERCPKLRSFPPAINLASLEELHLSGCSSLENFPEIPEEMENLKGIILIGTGIKELPCSFCNLSRLQHLTLKANEMYRILSVIGMMPRLYACDIELEGNKGRVSGEQEEGLHGILTHSLPSSDMIHLYLKNSNLSDDFFPLAVAWFPNVSRLDLRGNNFTVLPECIQQFHFLLGLNVEDCEHLREIRGIPPNLEEFSALNCKSLSQRGTSVLLNQQVHQGRSTHFVMPGGRIPRWFEGRSSGASISFWFRGTEIPCKFLCFAILLKDDFPSPLIVTPIVTINGNQDRRGPRTSMDQLFMFSLEKEDFYWGHAETLHLERGWNHAKLSYDAYKDYEDYGMVPSESIAKE
ncbi:TMV resistance protein N [Arachis hypogaea]|nr:TMV resistance protein N [Arachis hypogaea]